MANDARLAVQLIGGPTVLIDYAGLRLLTDPTFDGPGEYPIGERKLVKTEAAALKPDACGQVDAILLSHHQHPDNLDRSGREFLGEVSLVLTTPASAAALGGAARGLETWKTAQLFTPGGDAVTVTAVPARHGPPGCEPKTGLVTGFVLTAADLPTVYVSGDNAALGLVSEIASRFAPVDVAILYAGAARTPLLDAFLTLTSTMAADAARILDARVVVAAHFRGWEHFTEGGEALRAAFEDEEILDRLVLLEPGQEAEIRGADVAVR